MNTAIKIIKICPVCEHWNNIITNPEIGEIEKSQARVNLCNHQYFKHFKEVRESK